MTATLKDARRLARAEAIDALVELELHDLARYATDSPKLKREPLAFWTAFAEQVQRAKRATPTTYPYLVKGLAGTLRMEVSR